MPESSPTVQRGVDRAHGAHRHGRDVRAVGGPLRPSMTATPTARCLWGGSQPFASGPPGLPPQRRGKNLGTTETHRSVAPGPRAPASPRLPPRTPDGAQGESHHHGGRSQKDKPPRTTPSSAQLPRAPAQPTMIDETRRRPPAGHAGIADPRTMNRSNIHAKTETPNNQPCSDSNPARNRSHTETETSLTRAVTRLPNQIPYDLRPPSPVGRRGGRANPAAVRRIPIKPAMRTHDKTYKLRPLTCCYNRPARPRRHARMPL